MRQFEPYCTISGGGGVPNISYTYLKRTCHYSTLGRIYHTVIFDFAEVDLITSDLKGSNIPYTGIFDLYQGPIYHIHVYSTLPRSNIPNSATYSTLSRSNIPYTGIFDLTKVEYTKFMYIRPYQGPIYHIPVYSILPRSNIPYSCIFDPTKVEYTKFRHIFDPTRVEYTIYRHI